MAKKLKQLPNTFGRRNRQIPEREWREINDEILESGITSMVYDYVDNNKKVNFTWDIMAESKMQDVVNAIEELEKYLEVEKYDEDKDYSERELE